MAEEENTPKFDSPEAVRDMSDEDFDKALAEGVTIPGSGGQVYKFKTQKNPFLLKK